MTKQVMHKKQDEAMEDLAQYYRLRASQCDHMSSALYYCQIGFRDTEEEPLILLHLLEWAAANFDANEMFDAWYWNDRMYLSEVSNGWIRSLESP